MTIGSIPASRARRLSQHRPDSLRSWGRPWSSKDCASTEDRQWLGHGRRGRCETSPQVCRRLPAGPDLRRMVPRLQPPHGPLRSGRRQGWSSQAIDPAQDLGEQRPQHGDIGELEDEVASAAHDPGHSPRNSEPRRHHLAVDTAAVRPLTYSTKNWPGHNGSRRAGSKLPSPGSWSRREGAIGWSCRRTS